MATTLGDNEVASPRRASAPESISASGNHNRPRVGRTMSNTPSFASVTTIALHGNCPHCRHWHNQVRFPLNPVQYKRIHCQKCKKHWFSLGGNSTHTSLLSQETNASGDEDQASAIDYAICSSATASLAFATPGFQDVQGMPHLTAVVEDQSDHDRLLTSNDSQASETSPLSPRSFSAEMTNPEEAALVGNPEVPAQAPPQPTPDQLRPTTKGILTSPEKAQKPSSRFRRRLKKFLAHLGLDVEFRISRIKASPGAANHSGDGAEKEHDHPNSAEDFGIQHAGFEEATAREDRRPEPFKGLHLPEETGDLHNQKPQGPDRGSCHNCQSESQDPFKPENSEIDGERRAKRHAKTMLARANMIKSGPVRCDCQPNCHCIRPSVSSAQAFTSRSTPDLFINTNIERNEFRALDHLDFRLQHESREQTGRPQRSVSPELSYTGAGFPSNMARPSDVAVSEDSQDQGERSRQASRMTATSRLSGNAFFSESPRGSATLPAVPIPPAPSPVPPPSPRSPLHRSSTQDDPELGRIDIESPQVPAQDFGRSREEGGLDTVTSFDRRHSSGVAEVREARNLYASLDSMASFPNLRLFRHSPRS